MWTRFSKISLTIVLLVTGFYGGTGFFILMGGNPAVAGLSAQGFAEYWQQVDLFMGARMPIFGPIMLLSILVTLVSLWPARRSASFWLIVLALLLSVGDIVFTLSTNHPLNQLIQSWDLQHLPANVEAVQTKVVDAFWYRSFFMLSVFACTVFATMLRERM
jgi:MFS superfamily sulfate permease-like transporter